MNLVYWLSKNKFVCCVLDRRFMGNAIHSFYHFRTLINMQHALYASHPICTLTLLIAIFSKMQNGRATLSLAVHVSWFLFCRPFVTSRNCFKLLAPMVSISIDCVLYGAYTLCNALHTHTHRHARIIYAYTFTLPLRRKHFPSMCISFTFYKDFCQHFFFFQSLKLPANGNNNEHTPETKCSHVVERIENSLNTVQSILLYSFLVDLLRFVGQYDNMVLSTRCSLASNSDHYWQWSIYNWNMMAYRV